MLPVYVTALRREEFWAPDVAARVREVGKHWARTGGRLDDLLNALNITTCALVAETLGAQRVSRKRNAVLRRFGTVSGRVAIELAVGFRDGERDRLAAPAGAEAESAVGSLSRSTVVSPKP